MSLEIKSSLQPFQLKETKPTKINDIEYFEALVNSGRGKQSPVMAHSSRYNGTQMGPKVLDEIQAGRRLFPKLDVAVDRRRNQKVCPAPILPMSFSWTF
jgi:hypothetical protein